MPCFLPQALVENLRAFDLQIAVISVNLTHVLLDLLPQRPTLGMPKHCAWRMFINVKQVQLTPQFSMVTLFSFFQHRQVLLQIVFAGPGRAINALKHFIAMVAPPISTCHLHQLEMLELAGTRHMGATTQIGEVTLAVKRYIFIGRNRGDDLCFVVLAQLFEILDGLVSWHDLTRDGLVLRSQLCHLLFNQLKIVRGERSAV